MRSLVSLQRCYDRISFLELATRLLTPNSSLLEVSQQNAVTGTVLWIGRTAM